MTREPLVIGTRASALALWQARFVQERLEAAGIPTLLREFTTKGDRILDVPLAEIGDKGLFTHELDAALLDGSIHLAVHSLKDLPTRLPTGLVLGAVSEREEPWDAFVAHPDFPGKLEEVPEGAVIGTSSLRRQAQLLAWRPDLRVEPVRGNVGTRLSKLDASSWRGVILAAAGLLRLGLAERIRQRIDPRTVLPAVSQGALGIVCAERDDATRAALFTTVHDSASAAATGAERAFLRRLEGGCQVPIGAYASFDEERLVLDGCVAAVDGSVLLRDRLTGTAESAAELGVALAERLLEKGAGAVLRGVREDLASRRA